MNERDIFIAARHKQSRADRAAFLADACGGDDTLRRRVLTLLEEQEQLGSFLESAAAPRVPRIDEPIAERPGTVIGPYKLLEQIGEGGFGVVFLAEQTQPVRRQVALKVLKAGMDTKQVVARFEAERQALAIMDHPNIAKVFDGGDTGEPSRGSARISADDTRGLTPLGSPGRPYFVMELVKGVPITDFCDQHQLTPRQRLELFIPVCQAVQHAHQKGVIHRDLKPSNVLVTVHDTKPVPKIIDFGVAKALQAELTDKSLFTGVAQMIGTPLYMSPEQAGNGLDVDTRSDIYSLGVLLYELLTGSTPFDNERFKQAAYDEIRRIIRDEDPPKPSTRLSVLGRSGEPSRTAGAQGPARLAGPTSSLASISAQRQTEPEKLTKLLRGELDWIVMKALEKDRNRRYETANSLALDLRRYLADEPVHACPPSVGYRFRKFARRHKGMLAAVGGAALALVLLVAGLIVHNVAVGRERDEKQSALDVADAQRQRAQANLQHSLDAIAGMLDLAEGQLASLPQAEGVQEKFLQAALESCQRIGDAEGGDPGARRLTARAYTLVGRIKWNLGHPVEGEQALRKALDLLAKLAEDDPADLQHQADRAAGQFSLGVFLRNHGRAQEAEPLLVQSVALWKQVVADPASKPGQQRQVAQALEQLGYLHWIVDRHRQAVDCYQEALQLLQDLHAAFPKEADDGRGLEASLHNSLGVLFRTTGRLSEAEQAFRQGLRFKVGQEDRSRLHLGVVLWMMGRLEEAEQHQREAVRLRELGVSQHPKGTTGRGELGLTYRWLGLLLISSGKTPEAEQMFQKALNVQEALAKEFPDETSVQQHLGVTRRYLGNLLRDTARWPEAEAAYRAALKFQEVHVQEKAGDADDVAGLALTCKDFGNLLAAMGKVQDAKPYFERTRQGLRQALQLRPERYTLHDHLARFLAACPDAEFRDPGAAVASAKKAVELAPQVGSCWTNLGIANYRIGNWQESAEALQKGSALRAGGDGFDWFFHSMVRWQLGEKEQARTWYDRAVQWMEKHQPQNEELIRFRAEAAALLSVKVPKDQPE